MIDAPSTDDVPLSQQHRLARVTSPLAPDRLILIEISGSEYVNEIGLFRLRVMCPSNPLTSAEIDNLIGATITVSFDMGGSLEREFIQTCFGLRSMGRNETGSIYELELRPWFWVLSRRQNSRIFHNLSVGEILAEVLSANSMDSTGFAIQLGATYPVLEYTVQYQETDLNFVRRLMEEFGINFHLSMSNSMQTLVMSDDVDDFDAPIARWRAFQSRGGMPDAATEIFDTWIAQRHLTTGAVRMSDYNFKTPDIDMQVSDSRESAFSPALLESYEYPGRYVSPTEGRPLARRRLDALRGADSQARASGHAPSLGAGMKFSVQQDEDNGVIGEHAVIAATHHFFGGGFVSGGSGGLGYHGEYSLVPTSLPLAPERVTPRPFLRGPQSAVVTVGADGDVDEFGRIKVRFPWDQSAESMYCRVSQMWAGSDWGTQFIPRVGMEVLVDFLEGDPDRPVIVGCLYNDTNRHPGELPEKKSTSGIKTQTMGGTGFNALIFEDKADAEEIYIHAQKDLMIHVLDREIVKVEGTSKREITGTSQTIVDDAVTLESLQSIELKVGTSSILIEPSKITISSPAITIEAQGQLEATGTITKLSAATELTVEGMLVRIN